MSANGGFLISIEGLDGSGKATQAKCLLENLKKLNLDAFLVSFPDYSSLSSSLVKMYLNSEIMPNATSKEVYAVSSFFAVDRYVSYVDSWKKFYEEGQIIIADRYTTSNAIYQLGALEKNKWDFYLNWLEDYEYVKLGLPKPNLVLYLDLPVNQCQNLILKRYCGDESKKDLYEKNIEKLCKTREVAMYVSKKCDWKVINCLNPQTRSIKSVNEISKMLLDLVMGVVSK